MDFEMSGIFA